MYLTHTFELPPHLKKALKKATFLEKVTVVYLISVIVVMFLVMGSSQAMKTAWLEDLLSIVPSIAFLVSTRIYNRPANKKFPYGYHRVFSIAFLTGSLALFGMGMFLIVDSSISLISGERPTIGSTMIFGKQIWLGWFMIIALLYSAIPAMILGHKKQKPAKDLHNKILHTDATTQKADYMTAGTAILGIIGVGYGLWWFDAIMAILISISVIKDGYNNLTNAITDLMDRVPYKIGSQIVDPLLEEIEKTIAYWSWVEGFEIRFREHGQVYFGEIKVLTSEDNVEELITEGIKELKQLHWKIHDITIMQVKSLHP
ncbi:cation diffusion facilitator family transporter [Mariniflexile fucanivorans]|uniref:Cation diffusion facilitator family transporter n=1 Tax=Mariniflexile fucanivorans TaxID=264023 RepID=A0A4R1RNV8_9FLAO|nr:cation diffusion facilitator family transporter [Mariniflexile fucanivorans]TCL67859.1 cation diffusion facilitator family transporter [Mariniflexile fucanivorans]